MLKLQTEKEIVQMKIKADMELAQFKAASDEKVAMMNLQAANIKASSDQYNSTAEAQVRQNIAAMGAETKAIQIQTDDTRKRDEHATDTALEVEKMNQEKAKVLLEIAAEGQNGNDVNIR
jgi:hypothetical protein